MSKKNSLQKRILDYMLVLFIVMILHIFIDMVRNLNVVYPLPWYGPIVGLGTFYIIPFVILFSIYIYARIKGK